jgi:hypothetical protein
VVRAVGVLAALLAMLVVLGAGCATGAGRARAGAQPDNVFKYPSPLPADLKRVALLPIACAGNTDDLVAGCRALQSVVTADLIETKRFEVKAVDAETMREHTGQPTWSGDEVLPHGFFESVREWSGCDAVMFCELTTYRAYAPVAIGWRMKLVDARTNRVLWAMDQVFDSKERSEQESFWHTMSAALPGSGETRPDWALWNSPAEWGRYSAARAFATLPDR